MVVRLMVRLGRIFLCLDLRLDSFSEVAFATVGTQAPTAPGPLFSVKLTHGMVHGLNQIAITLERLHGAS